MNISRFLFSLVLLGCVPAAAQTVKQEPPQVNLDVSRNVAPGPKIRLSINTRNVAGLRASLFRLSNPTVWLRRMDNPEPSQNALSFLPDSLGTPAKSWLVEMRPPREKKNLRQIDVYRSRQVNLPLVPPGVYAIEVSGAGERGRALVNITNLAVVTKRSKSHLLAWVTDFRSGAPVKGARVTLWDRSGHAPVTDGLTGGDGSAFLPVAPSDTPQTVVASQRADFAGLVTASQDPDGKLTMHFQTDRPIYRPGQKASWKAILRLTSGNSWKPLSNTDCTVEVRDAKDVVLQRQTMKTNAIGTLAGEVGLPEEGSLGQYSVVISAGGADRTEYGSFSVAEYRKPEFQVALAPEHKRYLSGEKATFNLKATYYFGAAVPGATVHYVVRRSDLPFFESNDESSPWYGGDGNLYARDTYGQNEVVADATADLDAAGTLNIEVPVPADSPDSTYSIAATVIDGAKRQVEASASVPVYSAAKRLSVSSEVSYVPLGTLMPLRVRVADLDGKPASGTVTLVLKQPVYNEKEQRNRYVEITRTTVLVPASGVAKATIPAQKPGELRIEATMPDGSGRTARTAFSFYASDPNYVPPKEKVQPAVTLKLDKKLYRPGDVAKVLVSTNVGTRPVLAVVEGLDIWAFKVIPAGTKSFVWPVPAKLEMTPNAYLSAQQWTKDNGLIADNAVMPLPDPSRKLTVSIKADKRQYRPGEKATYTLQTRDDKGAPISAEVAVGVVDEALYAVRPDTTSDLYSLFWAMRENIVTTSSSAPDEQSGGAYQRVNKMAGVRQQFLDTAFWNARIQTNAQGVAVFAVPIPGNLTTWRATARAITGDTRVGIASDSVVATRPITLRLATPRQFVVGDQLDLIASANNRTTQDRTLETALSVIGAAISGPKVQTVQVKAGGEGRSKFPVTIEELPASGEVKFTGRTIDTSATDANASDLSDALESRVKVVPNGMLRRLLQGGTLADRADIQVALPADHIEPATTAVLSLRGGVGDVARALADDMARTERDTAPIAAARLSVATLVPEAVQPNERLENIALLARYETGDGGWGWWEDDRSDAQNTAFVLSSLARAKSAGLEVPDALLSRGEAGAKQLYDTDQLGEHRALLAAAIALADKNAGLPLLNEVARRSENLSPYARLVLGEAFLSAGQADDARQIADDVLKDAVVGPDEAFLRVGERPGWTATTFDASSAALLLLVQLKRDPVMQTKLARFLCDGDGISSYSSLEAQTVLLRALLGYTKVHPSARELGQVSVSLNGQAVKVPAQIEGEPLSIIIPRGSWKDGDNTVSVSRDGGGEVFYSLETRVFVPSKFEFGAGVRVFRRYDAQNAGKAWDELKRPVITGEPIRCTVVVWPSERADAMRVTEPIPAGFEFIEDDSQYGERGEEEVRDGAVIHYLRGNGLPVTFRYYIRAESSGHVTALPATAEVLRRPDERGNSDAQRLEVKSE